MDRIRIEAKKLSKKRLKYSKIANNLYSNYIDRVSRFIGIPSDKLKKNIELEKMYREVKTGLFKIAESRIKSKYGRK